MSDDTSSGEESSNGRTKRKYDGDEEGQVLKKQSVNDPMSKYLFEIRTGKPDVFKRLIDIITQIVSQIFIRFDESGISISALDDIGIASVKAKMDAKDFEYFRVDQSYDLYLDTASFSKILTCVKK